MIGEGRRKERQKAEGKKEKQKARQKVKISLVPLFPCLLFPAQLLPKIRKLILFQPAKHSA